MLQRACGRPGTARSRTAPTPARHWPRWWRRGRSRTRSCWRRSAVAISRDAGRRPLEAPLNVAVARTISAPGRPEFGVGAVTPDGPVSYDTTTLERLGLIPADPRGACERERAEARRRLWQYRQTAGPVALTGRDALLVDGGLARGVTARAGPSAGSAPRNRGGSSSPCRCTPGPPVTPSRRRACPTRWCACSHRLPSTPSAPGTATSPRPATTRWPQRWRRTAPPAAPRGRG